MSKFVKIILVIFIFIITGVIVSSLRPNQLGDSIIFPVHQPQTTSIFIGGDIMLSRNVAGKMYETNNFNLPFEKIADEVNKADIAFANLESPFNDIGDHSVQNSLDFNADPKSIAGLQLAGFDILSTANNHALDQEMKGLNYTIDWLTANKILYTGSIPTKAEAVLPVIK